MGNASKASDGNLFSSRVLYVITLTAFTCVVSRAPLMGDSFICGISFIAYMLSKDALNIYLVLPAAIGMFPYISRGYDPWGYIAAIIICGLVFTGIRKVPFLLWQRGAIAGSLYIVVISIYSLATGSVYKMSLQQLIIEGVMIFLLIYIFDALYDSIRSGFASNRISFTAFVVVSLILVNGMGLSFMLWASIIFIVVWTLVCSDAEQALFATIIGGVMAYIMEQGQWGLMATVMIGVLAASYVKMHGFMILTGTFAGACLLAGYIESGVILGVDKYTLMIPVLLFSALYWKFGSKMKQVMCKFTGKQNYEEECDSYLEKVLKEKSAQMNDLAELYSTYLDSRSILSNQFNITRQVVDDIRWLTCRRPRKAIGKNNDKYGVEIAISQYAASGAINGDCCGWQDLGDGRIVMVISDGMGKGKKAAAESLMVTRTVISLLKSGVTMDLTLKMINTIMLIKEDEDSYATLDMVTVDKRSGKAKFYKIGAAPTLIRRKSNVEEVKLSAVPLGIVNGLKIRYVETVLKKDDWIIMMSDGVSDGGISRSSRDDSFLHRIKETAADVKSQDPQTMSDLIMNRAADSYIGKERDDLTVMVARIL